MIIGSGYDQPGSLEVSKGAHTEIGLTPDEETLGVNTYKTINYLYIHLKSRYFQAQYQFCLRWAQLQYYVHVTPCASEGLKKICSALTPATSITVSNTTRAESSSFSFCTHQRLRVRIALAYCDISFSPPVQREIQGFGQVRSSAETSSNLLSK